MITTVEYMKIRETFVTKKDKKKDDNGISYSTTLRERRHNKILYYETSQTTQYGRYRRMIAVVKPL